MIKKKNKSFTLIEIILAIWIFMLAAGGSFMLMRQTVIASSLAQSKLIAYYLAQEGVEMVRNIRDGNWLEQRSEIVAWDDGLASGSYEMDYNDSSLVVYQNQGRNLYLNSTSGFYYYPVGVPDQDEVETSFKRKITIAKLDADTLQISVRIDWDERGTSQNVEVSELLYNWYGY